MLYALQQSRHKAADGDADEAQPAAEDNSGADDDDGGDAAEPAQPAQQLGFRTVGLIATWVTGPRLAQHRSVAPLPSPPEKLKPPSKWVSASKVLAVQRVNGLVKRNAVTQKVTELRQRLNTRGAAGFKELLPLLGGVCTLVCVALGWRATHSPSLIFPCLPRALHATCCAL